MVDVAIEKLQNDSFNEAWAVFDKDGYTKHNDAFDKARDNKVKIAFSSISFEHWVLLHFEKNNTPFQKSANVIDYFKEKSILPNYTKKGEMEVKK